MFNVQTVCWILKTFNILCETEKYYEGEQFVLVSNVCLNFGDFLALETLLSKFQIRL